jgi:hypothetical protein
VDKAIDATGCYAVTACTSTSGVLMVAVAARESKGVFLSSSGGVSGTFRKAGLEGQDVRILAVQNTAARTYLWAAFTAEARAQGVGASRLELRSDGSLDAAGFVGFPLKWEGGSCERLAFADNLVFAASNRKGVLMLDSSAADPPWQLLELNCGLPLMNEARNFAPIEAVSAAWVPHPTDEGKTQLIVLAGGDQGVFRSDGEHKAYRSASATGFDDRAPLPARWLYCAAPHTITVVQDRDGRS